MAAITKEKIPLVFLKHRKCIDRHQDGALIHADEQQQQYPGPTVYIHIHLYYMYIQLLLHPSFSSSFSLISPLARPGPLYTSDHGALFFFSGLISLLYPDLSNPVQSSGEK